MHYNVVIIGSGFGGSMTGLTLADRTQGRNINILMLERGTWWTTPLPTVQDKEVGTLHFLRHEKHQPVQVWSSQNHFRGFIDLFSRCFRRTRDSSLAARWFPRLRNEDGLFETTWLGKRGLFGRQSDGVMIARSSGVGGGSLVYSNVTIRPPEFVLKGPRWSSMSWTADERHYYYELARDAIGVGVVHAVREREADGTSPVIVRPDRVTGTIEAYVSGASLTLKQVVPGTPLTTQSLTYVVDSSLTAAIEDDLRIGRSLWLDLDRSMTPPKVNKIIPHRPFRVNTGLSNILTRTARLDHWGESIKVGNPFSKRGILRMGPDPVKPAAPSAGVPQDPNHSLWIDRARAFQMAVRDMTADYGAVELSIDDLPEGRKPYATNGRPRNYCERQGRCNVGCLPGARHTLNKQLMRATLGTHDGTAPLYPDFEISPLSEVDVIRARPGGGYEVTFEHQTSENYHAQEAGTARRKVESRMVTADVVILAAGTYGSNEILLRSKARGTMPGLSDKAGFGFSPNGDYIAFLEPTKHLVGLIKGPVTTSFSHFETDEAGTGPSGPNGPAGNPDKFHTVEDQGVPPATASLIGEGIKLFESITQGNTGLLFVVYGIWRYIVKVVCRSIRDIFSNSIRRGKFFESEEELVSNMIAIAAMGRDQANATLRLGTHRGETSLRASKPGGASFWDDPIYPEIRATLARLAAEVGEPGAEFRNPGLGTSQTAAQFRAVPTSHPLGGCIMAASAEEGTVNEFGQPFDTTGSDPAAVHPGLYVADGSIVPSALGVNPSLTISALALRIADKVYDNHFAA